MDTNKDTNKDDIVTYEELKPRQRKIGSHLLEPKIKLLMEVVKFSNYI